MSPEEEAKLIINAVAVLHKAGYGRLKILSYVKEGIGIWRYFLFASDTHRAEDGQRLLAGDLPRGSRLEGNTPEEVADSIISKCRDLAAAALGPLNSYTRWYEYVLSYRTGYNLLDMTPPVLPDDYYPPGYRPDDADDYSDGHHPDHRPKKRR